RFPLLRSLKFDDIEYGIKASITDASIAKAAIDRDLSNGAFSLEISRPGVHLQGNARFDDIPISIDGGVFFRPKDGVRARYRVALTLDDQQRRQLGFEYLPDRIRGPIGVDLTYSAFEAGRAEADARLDLHAASLFVEEAGWNKAPDVPGTGRLILDLANEQITRLREIEVKTAGLYGKFGIKLTPDRGRIERVDIERLVIGGDDIAGHVALRPDGGWHVELHGPTLDLTHWLSDSGNDSLSRHSAVDPPLLVDARRGRLILGPRRQVRNVSAQLFREGDNWQAARIDARFVNGHELALRFGSEAEKRGLSFLSDDLGATLSLLDVTNNIVGGRVTITGQVSDTAGKRILRGHIDGENYYLIRAPGLAKALSLTSLNAIGSMLAGSGIPFSTLRGDFAYSEDRLVLENLLAYGGALGVTANGLLELGPQRLDIQGTIVPAYTLNSIIGNVPVLGSLLLGGEGQGLFAANYRATGSTADPQVWLNPLSALTPGFLRRLFQPNFGIPPSVRESLGAE
ncbi:MAG: AsmA-like C-terminal domain-containing protein, partial [Alphaproteobacteria bacterium]|nr:AsmA-like C-terminal domain-containing protein [Alphaproteobacteria bacterium]